MSIFDTISQAKTFEQGNWFKPGIFDVTVTDISHFNSGQGKGPMVAVRFNVESCQPKESTTPADFPPGSSASCVYVIQSQVGPSNLKQFLAGARALAKEAGKDPQSVTAESLKPSDYEKLCAPTSPLRGLKMRADCFTKQSKAGKPFVAISWGAR